MKSLFKKASVVALLMLTALFAFQQADAKTDVGVGISGGAIGSGMTFTANSDFSIAGAEFNFNTQGQRVDALVQGKYHIEALILGWVKPYVNGVYRGPTSLDTLTNASTDVGLALNVELVGTDVGIGVFGSTGGEFAKVSADDYLADGGYSTTAVENKNPDPTGINPKPKGILNLLVYSSFEPTVLNQDVDLKVQFMRGLVSEEDYWQAVFNTKTAFGLENNLGLDLNLQFNFDFSYQNIAGDGNTEYAFTTATTLGF